MNMGIFLIGCTSAIKIKDFSLLFCIALGLHYFAAAKIGCTSAIKIKDFQPFILYCARFALLCCREDRLHLGNKNKRLSAFYFVLRSVCTIFAQNIEKRSHYSLTAPCESLLHKHTTQASIRTHILLKMMWDRAFV